MRSRLQPTETVVLFGVIEACSTVSHSVWKSAKRKTGEENARAWIACGEKEREKRSCLKLKSNTRHFWLAMNWMLEPRTQREGSAWIKNKWKWMFRPRKVFFMVIIILFSYNSDEFLLEYFSRPMENNKNNENNDDDGGVGGTHFHFQFFALPWNLNRAWRVCGRRKWYVSYFNCPLFWGYNCKVEMSAQVNDVSGYERDEVITIRCY